MAKYITGTAAGPGAADAFFQVLRGHLTSNGWTEFDVLNDVATTRDIVFRGAAMDATANNRPFVRIKEVIATNSIDFLGYLDWDATAHAGMFSAGDTSASTRLLTQDTSFIYFIRANPVSLFAVAKIGVNYNRVYAGYLKRHLSASMSGVTKITGAIGAGTAGGTALNVSSDITGKLHVGQIVLLINNAHSNASANKERSQQMTVQALSATQITFVEAIPSAFDAGAVLGIYPSPMAIAISNSGSGAFSPTVYFSLNGDATRTSGTSQNGSTDIAPLSNSNYDAPPAPENVRRLGLRLAYQTSAPYVGTRGYLYHIFTAYTGSPSTVSNEDIGDTLDGATTYIVFGAAAGSQCDFIGPRETA
jgi:hypothetical protein